MSEVRSHLWLVLLGLLGLVGLGCNDSLREIDVVPSLPEGCLAGRTINEVRITALGDFPPMSQLVAAAGGGGRARIELPKSTRVVQIEGVGPTGVVAFGRTAPLFLSAVTLDSLPVAYGPVDGLCATQHLNYSRALHRATLLPSGNVLISGGVDAEGFAVPRLELYVTAGDLLGPAASFRIVDANGSTVIDPRAALGHAVTLLDDGGLLVTGGAPADHGRPSGIASEGLQRLLRDGTASNLPGLLGGGPRAFHGATRTADGRVVLTGGCAVFDAGDCVAGRALASSSIYDPATGRFSDGPPLMRARWDHQALLRGDGAILLIGGRGEAPGELPIEVFDPDELRGFDGPVLPGRATLLPTGALAVVGAQARLLPSLGEAAIDLTAPPEPRSDASVTALEDGSWLAAGGAGPNANLLLWDGRGVAHTLSPFARSGHTATRLLDGTVLLAGGREAGGQATTAAEIFLRSPLGPFSTLPAIQFDAQDDPYLPLRPTQVLRTGQLKVTAAKAGEGGRPGELALVAAVDVADVSLELGIGRVGPAAAAVILGWRSEADFAFVTLEPGQPVRLSKVSPGRSGQSVVSELCSGAPLEAAELPEGTLATLLVVWRVGQFDIGTPARSFLRCVPTPAPGRGQVGVGALFGTTLFDNLSVTR